MYISRWGEEIVIDNTLGNDYLEVITRILPTV